MSIKAWPLLLAGVLLVGCEQGVRKAESETSVAKAVVTTQMPVGAVSDDQLQRAADTAARIASTQASALVPGSEGPAPNTNPPAAQPSAQAPSPAPAPRP